MEYFIDNLTYFLINNYLLIFLLLIIIFIFLKSIYLLKESESIVIERLGKYHKNLNSGLHFIIPFIDNPRESTWSFIYHNQTENRYIYFNNSFTRIDLRESVYDFPKQHVITKDNVSIEINSVIYYQIFDAYRAVYGVSNLTQAIEKLTQTTLRNIIGSMDLDSTLSSRDFINEKLRLILDEAADKWGVHINRVELQDVNPPKEIQHAMEKQMKAERDRRAIILESEGKKKAAILEAEGLQESAILKAKGVAESLFIEAEAQAKAKIEIAKAEAEAIKRITESFEGKDSMQYLLAEKYIKSFSEITNSQNSKFIIVPYESSALMGSLTAIKKIFDEK